MQTAVGVIRCRDKQNEKKQHIGEKRERNILYHLVEIPSLFIPYPCIEEESRTVAGQERDDSRAGGGSPGLGEGRRDNNWRGTGLQCIL